MVNSPVIFEFEDSGAISSYIEMPGIVRIDGITDHVPDVVTRIKPCIRPWYPAPCLSVVDVQAALPSVLFRPTAARRNIDLVMSYLQFIPVIIDRTFRAEIAVALFA